MTAKHLLLTSLLLLCSCALVNRKPQPPAQLIKPDGSISQSGESPNPGTVSSARTDSTVSLPRGTDVVFDANLGTYTFHLSNDGSIVTRGVKVDAKGPTAFTPPAAPTPEQVQKGKIVVLDWCLSTLVAFVGGFFIYREHVKAGAALIAGAILYPIAKQFLSDIFANTFLVAACCVGGALFWAWHLMNDKQQAALKAAVTERIN